MVVLQCYFLFQAEDGIRDYDVTGVQTCALPILKKKTRGFGKTLAGDSSKNMCDFGSLGRCGAESEDQKSVVQGKSVDLGGRRIIKKKKNNKM